MKSNASAFLDGSAIGVKTRLDPNDVGTALPFRLRLVEGTSRNQK